MASEQSILKTIRKMVGVPNDYTVYDDELIADINSVFSILFQLGVGSAPFRIEDDTAIWSDYMTDAQNLDMVKTYIRNKVKLMFDPPSNGTLVNALENQCKEFESRINYEVDPGGAVET